MSSRSMRWRVVRVLRPLRALRMRDHEPRTAGSCYASGGCHSANTQKRRASNDVWVVHLEYIHRGTSRGRYAHHTCAIHTPLKVLVPGLSTRIKQRYYLGRHRVRRLDAVALELVAPMTREPEVLSYCWSSVRLRNKVFNFERNAGYGLRTQAISTAMASIFSDLVLEGNGDI